MKRLVLLLLICESILYAQPGGISSTELWLRADVGVTGNPVSQWNDNSGNNRHAAQAVASRRPSYNATDINFNPSFHYINGGAPINHNIGKFLDVPYHASLNGRSLTVFAVVDADDGTYYRSPWTTRGSPASGHILYRRPDNTYSYWNGGGGWRTLDTGVSPTGNYEIVTTRSASSGSNRINKRVFLQGKSIGSANNVLFSANTRSPFRIGKGATEMTSGRYAWDGDIAEIIVYSSTLNTTQRNRVESYLAIKYGLTLDQSIVGGQNYRDSASTVVWNASANSGYGNDIAGLGRDDTSSLHQKVSKSINSDSLITMATSSDFSSANSDGARASIGGDKSFVVWSNNNGSRTWTTTGAPAGGRILTRKWKVQESGTPSNVNIQVDVDDSDFDIDPFNTTLFFVKGTNLAAATPVPMTKNGSLWSIENIDFSSGDLFSFVITPTQINAKMIINEVLFRQKTTGSSNEEFVEFFVTQSGNLIDMMFADQDGPTHQYWFPDHMVNAGDYVVLYIGDGFDSSSGGVHKFYMNMGNILNDPADDILLVTPSSTYTTGVDGLTLDVAPLDYIAYRRSSGGAMDPIPSTTPSPTISWSGGTVDASGIFQLQSISLTPNGQDGDSRNDWEKTTTGDAASSLVTIDTNTGSVGGTLFISSDGHNNNGLPVMTIDKSSIIIDDPVNGTANPKRIPGATIRYCFTVDNTGLASADNVTIKDTLSGNGRDNLTYSKSGYVIQDNASACNCQAISDTSGTYNSGNKEVSINLGTIANQSAGGNSDRGCAYIETIVN